jgi:hypothetical protein
MPKSTRAVKKSVGRFTKCCFQNQYIANEFRNTYAESFYDFYTSHPYAPLGVGNLADEIGVLHTNPRLYYIPKQKH